MNNFVECTDCEFVYRSADGADPRPKGYDACPNCDGRSFEFTDD